jgi:hypothetical protein
VQEESGANGRYRLQVKASERKIGVIHPERRRTSLLRNEISPDEVLPDDGIRALKEVQLRIEEIRNSMAANPNRPRTENEFKWMALKFEKDALKKSRADARLATLLGILVNVTVMSQDKKNMMADDFLKKSVHEQEMSIYRLRNFKKVADGGKSGTWRASKSIMARFKAKITGMQDTSSKAGDATNADPKQQTDPKDDEPEDSIMDDTEAEEEDMPPHTPNTWKI